MSRPKPSKPDDYCHCFTPDVVTYRDTIGFVPWWIAFPAAFALLVIGLWLGNFTIKHFMQTEQPTVPTKAVTTERTQSWK